MSIDSILLRTCPKAQVLVHKREYEVRKYVLEVPLRVYDPFFLLSLVNVYKKEMASTRLGSVWGLGNILSDDRGTST